MTFQTYPLSPLPAYYLNIAPSLDTGGTRCRNALYYEGEAVIFTWTPVGADPPTDYEVYDWYGTLVDSGAVSGSPLNLGSAWDCGWYRVRFTGSNSDALFGDAYAASMFTVARDQGLFPTRPDSTFAVFNFKPNGYGRTDAEVDAGTSNGGTCDMILRTMFGVGAGRNEWTRSLFLDPELHADDSDGRPGYLDSAQWIENVGNPYWLDDEVKDPVRERKAWLAFDVQTWDWKEFELDPGVSLNYWLLLGPKDTTIDPSNLYVTITAGSVSGHKVTVYYPNNSTVVETYDNLATPVAADAAILAGSDYIHNIRTALTGVPVASRHQPRSKRGTKPKRSGRSSEALYPAGFTHFEGPYNEWTSGTSGAWLHEDVPGGCP